MQVCMHVFMQVFMHVDVLLHSVEGKLDFLGAGMGRLPSIH